VLTFVELQQEVDARMRHGDRFSDVEDELIEPCRLSQEAKAALWLYGFAFADPADHGAGERSPVSPPPG
jgi:hypothetical protein